MDLREKHKPAFATDPATAANPIKRSFLFDGQHFSCNWRVALLSIFGPFFDRTTKNIR